MTTLEWILITVVVVLVGIIVYIMCLWSKAVSPLIPKLSKKKFTLKIFKSKKKH
jgi:hypothetical protein